jgi:hypothetical protein
MATIIDYSVDVDYLQASNHHVDGMDAMTRSCDAAKLGATR